MGGWVVDVGVGGWVHVGVCASGLGGVGGWAGSGGGYGE